MRNSHFKIRTFMNEGIYKEDAKCICLDQELVVEDIADAINYAKGLKKLMELDRIQVIEYSYGYSDRIVYEFERSWRNDM